jgi:hypothetical protein
MKGFENISKRIFTTILPTKIISIFLIIKTYNDICNNDKIYSFESIKN